MKTKKYTVTIKGSTAKVRANGHAGFSVMHESHVWENIKHVTKIAAAEDVKIEWAIVFED